MKTRVISALIAVGILIALVLNFHEHGLEAACIFASLGAAYEFSRLAFRRFDTPQHIQWIFGFLSVTLFFTTFLGPGHLTLVFAAVSAVILCAVILLTVRTSEELAIVLQLQALSLMGLFYCGVFTGLITRLLTFERGETWFFGLLAIVFTGDTFAYVGGRAFGRHKLLEPVSPKKTIEGSLGGLLGSALAGAVFAHFFLSEYPFVALVLMSLITGAFAQVGDLFESLIKRVADVKDSGRIMPGHGGILDRLDGVLFAAPVYFALVAVLH